MSSQSEIQHLGAFLRVAKYPVGNMILNKVLMTDHWGTQDLTQQNALHAGTEYKVTDINKCKTNPCGTNARCTNTLGSFNCVCDRGFVSNTGKFIFNDKTKTQCRDINECESDPCGANATCTNRPGDFSCTCNGGFVSTTGERNFKNKTKTQCRVIDACESDPCGANATCTNRFRDFYCTCNGGFVSTTGEYNFKNKTKTQCRDIDECLQDPCGPQAVCNNTEGSFTCKGAASNSKNFTETCIEKNKIITEQCSSNNLTEAEQSSWTPFHIFCSKINSTITLVSERCHNQSAALPLEEIISTANDLLANGSLLDNMERAERLLSASIFLQSMENVAIAVGLELPDMGTRRRSTKNVDLEVRVFRGKSSSAHDRASLQANGIVMDIYRRTVTGGKANVTGFAAVALIAYNNMDSILIGSVFNLSTSGGKLRPFRLISNVVSAAISNRDSRGLDPTVNITFRHKEEANGDGTKHCVHWNYAAGKSYWSPNGCSVADSNGTHTQCRCNHFSSLALLMTPFDWQGDPLALTIITSVGIPVSLVCLGITIVTFAFRSSFKNAINATHVHLCASLFLAELLFITGIDRNGNRVVCGIVAGFLHYLFLAAFVWMFLEGVQLYLMVRNIRKLRASHSGKIEKYMSLCGYGTPAVIVVISAAVYPDGYGSPRHCWISKCRGFVWSFLGPVYVIIGINSVLFFTILWILKKEISKRDTQVSKLQGTRARNTDATVVLSPVV
ncbi:adhesion G protein-coupled receptor E2-like [Heptranchias perlo]|uniref:adhesion G protein-coupled receptor E2-like n=1 Tax=Heptranchias perlo TaxID=212740 RepID=UPI00355ABA04